MLVAMASYYLRCMKKKKKKKATAEMTQGQLNGLGEKH